MLPGMRVRVVPLLAALGASLALGASASAQEVIAAGPKGAPPTPDAAVSEDGNSPEAIGAWGRRVLAGAPAPDAKGRADGSARPGGCPPAADRRPHGAVWGGIGTGGYREVGGTVTQALGDCGQVSVAIDKVEGRFGPR